MAGEKKNKWKKKNCVRHNIFRNFVKTYTYTYIYIKVTNERFFLSLFWVKVPVAFNNNMTGLNKKMKKYIKIDMA